MYYILIFFLLIEIYNCNRRKRISFSFLFQLSYWIVFFQIDLLISSFDYFSYRLTDFIFVNEQIKVEAILLSQLALLAFIFGNFFKVSFAKFNHSYKYKPLPEFRLGNIETLTGFLLFLYILMSGDMILGEYTPLNTIPGRLYVYRLFLVIFYINLIFRLQQVTYFSKLQRPTKNVIILYLLLSLFIGDRGPIIVVGFIFLIFYMRENRISIFKSISFGLIFAVILSVIGSVRQLRYVESSYANRISLVISNFGNMSSGLAEGGIFELSKSGRALPVAIEYKRNGGYTPFIHFQTMYLLSSFPFLSGFYLEAKGLNSEKYSSSSSLISYQIQNGDVQYGNGTSIIADLYLDLGFYGSIFMMFIFGFFIKKAEDQFYNNKQLNIYSLVYIIYFSVAIYLPRSALLMQLEKIVFILIIIFIFSMINKKKLKKFDIVN